MLLCQVTVATLIFCGLLTPHAAVFEIHLFYKSWFEMVVFELTPFLRNGFGDVSKGSFFFVNYFVMPMNIAALVRVSVEAGWVERSVSECYS